jgi:hypothetical protein
MAHVRMAINGRWQIAQCPLGARSGHSPIILWLARREIEIDAYPKLGSAMADDARCELRECLPR